MFSKKSVYISISWKFTLIYFLILMVPTVLIGIGAYQNMVQSVKQQSDGNVSERLFQLKQNILYTIKNTENIAEEIILGSEFQAFLDDDFSFSPAEIENFVYTIQNKLLNIKHLYPNKFYKIRIFSSNKATREYYDIIYSLDRLAGKGYFKSLTAPPQKMLKFRVYPSGSSSQVVAIAVWGDMKKAEEFYDVTPTPNPPQNNNIVIPLYERITPVMSNKLIGILEIDILTEKMFGDLNDLQIGEGGSIFVLDGRGAVISPHRHNPICQYLTAGLLPGDSGIKEVSAPASFKKQRYRIQYETIKETNYKLAAVVPEREILSRLSDQKNALLYTLLAGTAVVFLITFLTTNILLSRLKVLVKMMKRIQSGEFGARVAEKGNDEIGDLARSFNQMSEKLEEVILNLIDRETAQRDAEIRALQSQINPHFLFNTLESLRMECELREEYDLSEVIMSLGKLFRYNIKWVNHLVPLRQEIEHIRNYITVMKMRHRDKFQCIIDIPEALQEYLVIKMMLQPLVENCFYHAFKSKEGLWLIEIRGTVRGEDLYLEVADNGMGIAPEQLTRINRGLTLSDDSEIAKKTEGFIGLWNVDKRIKIQFGDDYGITLASPNGVGTTVTIKIPVNT